MRLASFEVSIIVKDVASSSGFGVDEEDMAKDERET